MNRHIKHWFRLYAKDFPFCEDCIALPDYNEINDDGPESFPDEVRNLNHLTNLKLPYTSDGSFMQCRKCKTYYWYRSFAPGGSEDAMRTVNHETISKMGLLGVYMELREAVEVSSTYYKQYAGEENKILYKMYLDEFKKLKSEAGKHFDYIDENKTILIKDVIVCLRSNASSKDNKYCRVDLIPAEEEATLILIQYLKRMDDLTDYKKDLEILMTHANPKVSVLIKKFIKKNL